jgi:hypothetical protein
MPRYKMVVLSHPVDGREDEYNDWYQNTHLGQVMAFRGFTSAQRFRLVRNMTEQRRQPYPYAAIYEIETDDLDSVLAEVQAQAGSERLSISEAIATEFAYAAIYEECGAEVKAAS